MSSFNVLALGEFIASDALGISLNSFADFYNCVTSKHQKKSRLIVIEEGAHIPKLVEQSKQYDFGNSLSIIDRKDQDKVINAYQQATLLLFPTYKKMGNILTEALSFGLPILCFEHPHLEEYVDHTCGMFIENISLEQSIQEFAEKLHMLYFDPEARKILRKGAQLKYETQFTWNSKRRQSTTI